MYQYQRKGKVMALQRTTRDAVERAVSRKENFKRGNVSGKWENKNYFYTRSRMGMLDKLYADVLEEHSKTAELFVLYSYATPMAWYSLNDNDSNGTGKWYYVEDKYSVSTTQHQNAFRMSLKGENVVTLTRAESGVEVAEDEKEFY